jgi:hypothetical protein
MKSARSGSAAFGVVASAALVSSGILGGLLGGGTAAEAATVSAAAPNVCGQPPARTSAARSVPAGQTAIVLDAVSLSSAKSPKPKATKSATAKSSSSPSPSASASQSATAKATATATAKASATATATAKATATASSSATPKATATASATPKATDSASATPSSSASPSSSTSADPSSSASASPSGSASASPSPSSTGSSSASPSPSPSPTGSSPSVQLCLSVQPVTTKSGVHPGGTGSYAIWVWPAGGAASDVTVTISGKVASQAVTPKFTVCPTVSGRTCKVGGIAKGSSDELQATIAVPSGTAAGKQASLSATANASNAAAPPAADGAIKITAKPSASHSPSPSPTPTPTSSSTGTGLGATLPAGILPTVPSAVVPGASLGELPQPTTSAGSPGGLFPTVSPQPSPSPSPYSAVLPNARAVRVTDAAATFPFSTRLVGGELVGLAVLAAALAIAIVRFSLRRPRPQHGKDATS